MNIKRVIKNSSRTLLIIVLCLSMIAPYFTKVFAEPEQEVYISDIKLVNSSNSKEAGKEEAIEELENAGYTVVPYDLNNGTGYGWAYLGYKTTTDPEEAITDIKVMNMKGGWTESTYATVTAAYSAPLKTITNDMYTAIKEFRTNYTKGSPAANAALLTLNKLYIPEKDNIRLGDFLLFDENEDEVTEFLKEFLLKANPDIATSIYAPLTLGTMDYDPDAEEAEADGYISYSWMARVKDFVEPSYDDEAANALLNERAAELINTSLRESVNRYYEAINIDEDERTDVQKMSIQVHDTLNNYKTNNNKNLGDVVYTKNIKTKVIRQLVSALTDGQYAMIKYAGIEAFVMAAANTEAGFDMTYEVIKEDGDETYSVWTGVDMDIYSESVALTNDAIRKSSATKDFEFYKTRSGRDIAYETIDKLKNLVGALGLICMGAALIGKALGTKIVITASSWLITQGIAWFLSTTAVSTIASILSTVGTALGYIAWAIEACLFIALAVMYLIDTFYVPETDYSKAPTMPLLMYDAGLTSEGENVYVCYDLVTSPYGDKTDLNVYQGREWIGVYTTKDENAGSPILADSFYIRYTNGTAPDGYYPMARFGEAAAYNTNSYAKNDDHGGIFVFFQKTGEMPESTEGMYLSEVAIFAGDDDSNLKQLISNSGYYYANYNMGNHMQIEEYPYVYMCYKTTNVKSQALTDIRIRPATSEYLSVGESVSYTNAKIMTIQKGTNAAESVLFAGFALAYTTYEEAGDPILSDFYFSNDAWDTEVPEGYEPINLMSGGPAYNFNLYTMDQARIGTTGWVFTDEEFLTSEYQMYVYFHSSEVYSENPDYLSGITFTVRPYGSGFKLANTSRIIESYGYTLLRTMDTDEEARYLISKKNDTGYGVEIGYSTTKNPKRAVKKIAAYSADKGITLPMIVPVLEDGKAHYYTAAGVLNYYMSDEDTWATNIEIASYMKSSFNGSAANALYVLIQADEDPILASDFLFFESKQSGLEEEGYIPVQNFFDHDNDANIISGISGSGLYMYYKGTAADDETTGNYISSVNIGGGNSKDLARLALLATGEAFVLMDVNNSSYTKDSESKYVAVGATRTDDEDSAITGLRLYVETSNSNVSAGETKKHNNVTYKLTSTTPIMYIRESGGKKYYPVFLYYSTNPACGSPITSFEIRKSFRLDGAELIEFNDDTGKSLNLSLERHVAVTRESNDAKYVSDLAHYRGWFKYNDDDILEVAESRGGYFNNMSKTDLNSNAGGRYLYLFWKNSKVKNEAITDIVSWATDKSSSASTRVVNGITYYLACGGQDFNEGAGGKYIYLYYTKDTAAGDPIGDIVIDKNKTLSGYETVENITSSGKQYKKSGAQDMNKGAGGDYVYIHIKRVQAGDQTNFVGSIFSENSTVGIFVGAGLLCLLLAAGLIINYNRKRKRNI